MHALVMAVGEEAIFAAAVMTAAYRLGDSSPKEGPL